MEPVTSPATHSLVVGQEISQMTDVPSTSVSLQVAVDAEGSFVVNTLPALSVATQSVVPAQVRPAIQ
jgi:hypothetical protein